MKHKIIPAMGIALLAVSLAGCNLATIKARLAADWSAFEADVTAAEAAIQANCTATQIVIADIQTSVAVLSPKSANKLKAIATAQAGLNTLCNTPVNGANVAQISVQISSVYKAVKAAQAQ